MNTATITSHAKTFPVGWDELHRHAKALAWRLVELGPWKGIVAITRGGLVPAAIVARELDVRLVDTVCVASYQDRTEGGGGGVKGDVTALKGIVGDGDGEGYLIIDDLGDTGHPARDDRQRLPDADFATAYPKPRDWPLVVGVE